MSLVEINTPDHWIGLTKDLMQFCRRQYSDLVVHQLQNKSANPSAPQEISSQKQAHKLHSSHPKHKALTKQIQQLEQKMKPCLLMFDQLSTSAVPEHQFLKRLYQEVMTLTQRLETAQVVHKKSAFEFTQETHEEYRYKLLQLENLLQTFSKKYTSRLESIDEKIISLHEKKFLNHLESFITFTKTLSN